MAQPLREGFNLSALALRHRAVTAFFMAALALAGIMAYFQLGRAEDPDFTIREMIISAQWPGASADEMSREVADRIERKLEELPFLDYTETEIGAGYANLTVQLRDDVDPARVPELWYQVRKRVGDIAATLPQGVVGPFFNDDFKDVFGLTYAITGRGFTLPELKHVAEDVREGLLHVPGVGRITLLGVQDERIYIEFSPAHLAQLGISARALFEAVARENAVAPGGFVDTRADRIMLRAAGRVAGPAAIAALPVQAHGHLFRLGDIARVVRGTVDPPAATMDVNGTPCLGIAVSMAEGGNILDLGQALARRVAEIEPGLPLGVHLERVFDQETIVRRDVADFQAAFFEALAIVLLVSFVSLGWRTGIVVAVSVPLVLAGVMVGMHLLGIDLQRISLGAMVIALGLLVDDAIIAVETMAVKLEQGYDRLAAGSFAYSSTAFPMLTGTLVTAAGYLPIGLAQSTTGEYTRDIFRVVGMALILSWLVAVLFVPYLGAVLLPAARGAAAGHDPYDTAIYHRFRGVVRWCVDRRLVVLGGAGLAFLLALGGFALVPQQFFPASERREVIVDLEMPDGSSFAATAARVAALERIIAREPHVVNWTAFTGSGTPRFYLASVPVLDRPDVAQVVINMDSLAAKRALVRKLNAYAGGGADTPFADVRFRASAIEMGPPVGYPVQFRVSGPDPLVLRQIGARVERIVAADPHVFTTNTDWGRLGRALRVEVDQDKARLLGMSSADVAEALQTLEQGTEITAWRDGTDLIPVVGRAVAAERGGLATLGQTYVPGSGGRSVPLSQIARVVPELELARLLRRARTPTLAVRGDIGDGTQAPVVTAEILPRLAPVIASLPPGYAVETGGAVEESGKGQRSVNAGLPVMVGVMLALLMLQLRSFGRVAIVLLTAPLGLVGVTAALLLSGMPFGFVAMLGFIALAGIIMRNSVILVDQIERDRAAGAALRTAIVEAAVRRARPILLTAAAAILALVPLAFSVFWGPMAVAIMGGLVSATVLTLCFVPALYGAWYGAARAERAAKRAVAPIDPAAGSAARGSAD